MAFAFFGELKSFLERHRQEEAVQALRRRLAQALAHCEPQAIAHHATEALDLAEALLWKGGVEDEDLARYQALCREYQHLTLPGLQAARHRFTVVIPVADRPRQLQACLESLFDHWRQYHYGGAGERANAIEVFLAEDSADPQALARHGELARLFSQRGLPVTHFDAQAQRAVLEGLPADLAEALAPVVGRADEPSLAHKGASRTRNLAMLALAERAAREPERLFWFVDSDETFAQLLCQGGVRRERAVIDLFRQLDRLFSRGGLTLLTGKVVGDPPVAPAVMAGNFLLDLLAFLDTMEAGGPEDPCPFHGDDAASGQAAYHDMADLFGFTPPPRPIAFACPLEGGHSRLAAFDAFCRRLDHFFDGVHPTRIDCHHFQPALESLTPARTVYTGNYVVTGAGLAHFIPFADLGLRMAGPVLGRLLKAQLGEAFCSANLPLLHRRAPESLGAEYRAGVARREGRVDLTGELERQFLGDVMLFTMERLVALGYPRSLPGSAVVEALLEETHERLRHRYLEQRRTIQERLEELRRRLDRDDAWWRREPGAAAGRAALEAFHANMEANFGAASPVAPWLSDATQHGAVLARMARAIARHPDQQAAWRRALALPPEE